MITSIRGIAYKFLKGNKFILFSAVIAIFISTSLIIGMFNFLDESAKNFKEDIKSKYGVQDILLGYEASSTKYVTKELEDRIREISGTQDLEGVLISNFDEGMIIGSTNGYMTKERYNYLEDLNENEVAITSKIKEEKELEIGDFITINKKDFKVKEIINENINFKIMNIDELRLLSGKEDGATYSLLKTNGENNNIAKKIQKIDKDFRVEIIEEYEDIKESQMHLRGFVSFFGFLILIIGSLFINSNMQNLLYKYKEQFSLLRSIGASGRKIFSILFIQSSIINLIGVGISLIFSYCFKILSIYSFIAALIIFIILELFTIVVPMKGLKVMPLSSFRENEMSTFILSKGRKRIGIALAIISLGVILLCNLDKSGENIFIYVFISNIGLIISFIMLLPFILNIIMNKVLTNIGKIISSSRRNYLCILIITITTIISVFGSNFLGVINKNSREYLRRVYPKDITVQLRSFEEGMGQEVYEKIQAIENSRSTPVYIDYVPMAQEKEVLDFSISFDSEIKENEVILSKDICDKYRISKGDILSVRKISYPEGGVILENGENLDKKIREVTMDEEIGKVIVKEISEKLPQKEFHYNGIMNIKVLENLQKYKDPVSIYIESDNVNEVMNKIKDIKKEYPQIDYGTYAEELIKDKKEMRDRWGIFISAIIVMIISTVLGVYNMILDYLNSRKDEIDILRSLGLTKKRLVMNIAYMIAVYFIVGIACGSILGIFMSVTLTLSGR